MRNVLQKAMLLEFINARVLRGDELVAESVFVRDGRFVSAVAAEDTSTRRTIDCSGKIICPGFIDIQNNGAFGEDFSQAEDLPLSISKCGKLLVRTGCTSFCPTLITSCPTFYKRVLPQVKIQTRNDVGCANMLGLHLEGPMIHVKKSGCHPVELITDKGALASRAEAEKLLSAVYGDNLDAVSIITLDASTAGCEHLVDAIVERGIIANLGHSVCTYAQGERMLAHGASGLTHLFNAMNEFTPTEPHLPGLITRRGVVGQRRVKLSLDKVAMRPTILYYGFICDLVHVAAAAVPLCYKLNPEGLCLITDAMAALGLPDGEYTLGQAHVQVGGMPRAARRKGEDTLAGVIAPINECVRNFVASTGCSLAFALKAASLTPALYLGVDHSKGKIEPGFDADFCLIDEDVNVYETWINGKKCYSAN
uniref:N-acetylglucosamine-6-phosphate deacetylase n=1 Tax=Dermatophagoides pteronyssinus TaxID=6956 RepID=A0A6P6Y8R2_DERPT|nr:N-acetylglucosamine-6-phosphate deacetylase-like [Dermatophagoides pteronyssinus]